MQILQTCQKLRLGTERVRSRYGAGPMKLLNFSLFTLRSSLPCLSLTSNQPLVGGNLFECHWSAGSKFLGTDANLCAQSELCAIGKAGRSVYINAGCIYQCLELLLGCFVVGNDALAVSASVGSDMVERLILRSYGLDTHLHAEPFCVPDALHISICFCRVCGFAIRSQQTCLLHLRFAFFCLI